jgi:hypothetical protein
MDRFRARAPGSAAEAAVSVCLRPGRSSIYADRAADSLAALLPGLAW